MQPSSHKRKSPRKSEYDYASSGAYFVTICTHQRAYLFGNIVNHKMQLSDVGTVAEACWLSTPDHFNHVTVDCFVVMPNHVHAIIVLDNQNDETDAHRNKTVGKRHASSQDKPKRGIHKNGRYIPKGVEKGSLGAVVGSYKSAVTKIVNRTIDNPPSRLWQTGYHDHIIWDEASFYTIRNYVLTNPERWDDDTFND